MLNKKIKLLSFSHQSAIWVHAFPEALCLDALRDDIDIKYITCDGYMNNYCISMSGNGLSIQSSKEKKEKICSNCKAYRDILINNFNFSNNNIEEFINNSDKKEISKLLNQNINLLKIQIEGINIGKIATYELLLEEKKIDLKFNEENIKFLKINVENCLNTYFAMKKILHKFKPDKVLIYNNNYAVNRILVELANKHNIDILSIHAGRNWSNRLEKMIIAKGTFRENISSLLKTWEKYMNIPINDSKIQDETTEHFLYNILSKSIFNYGVKSDNDFSFYDKYPKAKGKKIFLATLSSLDEKFAAAVTGNYSVDFEHFENQIDWINWLFNFFKKNKDYFLIIRIHPREYINKRTNKISENLINLQNNLKETADNISVNFPDQDISLFDLATEVDVLLNSHSSSSLDMLFLGIPVVLYDKLQMTFPLSMHYYSNLNTDDSYISQIKTAINDGWNIKHSINVYRWMYLVSKSEFNLSNNINWYREEKIVDQKILESKNRKRNLEKKELTDFVLNNNKNRISDYSYDFNATNQRELDLIRQCMKKVIKNFNNNSKLYKNIKAFIDG